VPASDWTREEDWDILYLGGKRVPGVASVEVSMASGIKTDQPKGAKKASQKDKGAPPAKVHVSIELLPAEIEEYEREIVPLLRPRNVFAPREPLEISHPNTRLWGINVVLPGEIESPHPTSGGTKKESFTLEEWAPQPTKIRKASNKPKNEDEAGWNVQPLIDNLRPANSGAAAANF
jgi:hypothetical protein